MDILHPNSHFHVQQFIVSVPSSPQSLLRSSSRLSLIVRSCLPVPLQKAKYHKELQAAVSVVEKACRLCVDVKRSLFSSEGRIVEKNDQTPVTVADFGVQALISSELNRLFPSIPLVAEEDSAFLRSSALADTVVDVINDTIEPGDILLTRDEVLEAIDRGGKDAVAFGEQPATYWILDPIDGTRGFLKGSEALYVVGLALVIDGKISLGVMGCPNWQTEDKPNLPEPGIVMISHIGYGTWTKKLSKTPRHINWTRCFVDNCDLVHNARFCIPESIIWDSLPLSDYFSSTTNSANLEAQQVLLLHTCCGSLCKYLMVASGKASVFIQRTRENTVIKAWDHAVGVICVLEAGGQVSDWEGNELDLGGDKVERRVIFPPGGVVATNGKLHNQILKMVAAKSSIT